IEPILERDCRQCHGDTVQLGKLDLSTRDSALRGGTRGSDIIPGNAEASPLSTAEVAAVKQWIDEGARWDAVAPSSSARPSATAALAAMENRVITPAE